MEIVIAVIVGMSIFSTLAYCAFFASKSTETPVQEQQQLVVVKPKKKTDAFIAGYKDMGTYGIGKEGFFFVSIHEYDDSAYSDLYSLSWDHGHDNINIDLDPLRNPSFRTPYIESIARQLIAGTRTLSPEKGQCSDKYLGGSDKDFQDYYAGGMALIADLDKAKVKVQQDKIDEDNRQKLIAARKKGLKAINTKTNYEIEALDTLRAQSFNPRLTEKEEWEKVMNS